MKVRELLSSREKWTQGESSRDSFGNPVDINSPNAVCWCLSGALYKCYRASKVAFLMPRVQNLFQVHVIDWNDDPRTRFEDVKALVDRLDI